MQPPAAFFVLYFLLEGFGSVLAAPVRMEDWFCTRIRLYPMSGCPEWICSAFLQISSLRASFLLFLLLRPEQTVFSFQLFNLTAFFHGRLSSFDVLCHEIASRFSWIGQFLMTIILLDPFKTVLSVWMPYFTATGCPEPSPADNHDHFFF